MAGEPLERIAICRVFLWSQAEEKAHQVERSDETLVQDHDQCKGDHGHDQILRQNAHIPAYHEPQIEQANEQGRNEALFTRILEMPPPAAKEPGAVK